MVSPLRSLAVLAVLIVAGWGTTATRADTLPAPTGRVILEVTGAITQTTVPGKAQFDRATLDAMAVATLETSTPWTKGVQRFEGFPLATLLKTVGATGTSIKAIALNDYSAVLPIGDSVASGAFVVVRQDGKPLSVRDRGPLWIVFPYDSDSRLTTDAYLNRSVLQIKELMID